MRKNDEWQSRRSMAEYGRKLLELGLVQGTWGNISVRLSANYMLVTPSGLDYKMIDGSDMVKVAIKTLTYGDGNVPTTEKGLHAGIYESRSDIGAIIHTHSKYCSIFAAARKPLQVLDEKLAKITGELIYISDYAYAGSRKLTKNVVKALGDRSGCIISNHGMIACGKDLQDALEICLAMEKAAEQYIEARISKGTLNYRVGLKK